MRPKYDQVSIGKPMELELSEIPFFNLGPVAWWCCNSIMCCFFWIAFLCFK